MEKIKYYPGIKRYVASRVNNLDDAEDITQDVFLEYHGDNNGDKTIKNPEPYLFGIARNLIAKHYQNKREQPKTIPIALVEEDSSIRKERDDANQLKKQQLKKILKSSLAQLSLMDYEIIKLSLSKGFSFKKIAEKSGISASVFYQRYHRALKNLEKTSQDLLKRDFDSR